MINIFADERQHSDNAEEKAEALAAIAHELAEIRRAADKLMADFCGGKTDPAEEEPEEEE